MNTARRSIFFLPMIFFPVILLPLLTWTSCAAQRPTTSGQPEPTAASVSAGASVNTAGGPTAATPLDITDGAAPAPLGPASGDEKTCQAVIGEIRRAADESGLAVTIRAGRGGVRAVVIHRGGAGHAGEPVVGVVFFQRASNLPFTERCVREKILFDIVKI